MKGALKAPRPTSYTTQALFGTRLYACACVPHRQSRPPDQMIAGDIDTDPDYQRGMSVSGLSYWLDSMPL